MTADKMSISMDGAIGADVRSSARRAGLSLSAWVTEAAAARLRQEALVAFFADYERVHGAFTEEELAKARTDLGLDRTSVRR